MSNWQGCRFLVCLVAAVFSSPSGGQPIAASDSGLITVLAADPSVEIRQLAQQALALQENGQLADAERTILRAIGLQSQAASAGTGLPVLRYFLASIYVDQGRFADAEPILKDVITSIDRRSGPDNVGLVSPLSKLGELYMRQGRYREAEPLLKRALAVNRKAFPRRPETAETLNSLASFYGKTGHPDLAEPLFDEAIEILRKSGPGARDELAVALGNQGVIEQTIGNYQKALGRFHDAYMANLEIHGPDHPFTIVAMSNAGVLYGIMGQYDQAEPLLKRSLEATTNLYGADALQTAHAQTALGWVELGKRDPLTALGLLRPAIETYLRARRLQSRGVTALAGGVEERAVGRAILGFLRAARAISDADPAVAGRLLDEAFRVAQEAHGGKAAQALALTTARFAADNGPLAVLIRQEQDLAGQWRSLSTKLTAAVVLPVAQRNRTAEEKAQKTLANLEQDIIKTDQAISAKFPAYATLAHPDALKLADAQRLLHGDEALVVVAAFGGENGEGAYLFIVTSTEARWRALDGGRTDLTQKVFALLCGLDIDLWSGNNGQKRCSELTHTGPPGDRLPFDANAAHGLFLTLFGDLAPMIAGKTLLVVAPDPLASLPFQVLVTRPPATAMPVSATELRGIAWLGWSNPIAVLPSVAGLAGLRSGGAVGAAAKPFIGFGDPTLNGNRRCPVFNGADGCPGEAGPSSPPLTAKALRGVATGGLGSVFRGGGIDVDAVRALCPLPETAVELRCIARSLNASESMVRTGAAATLTALRKERLDQYRVVEFATHGLVAGELKTESGALAEPVLVMTPDDSAGDDGLLRASEIATLKLNADWVVLSACNTAAGEALGGEAMSGLASAFIYAGTRALLVSHWPVGSDAAVRLTSKAFAEMAKEPTIGRAEALRRAIRDLIDNGGDADAMPSVWAPFSLVGDDGALRS